ncbi:sensor histidine kinase [Paenibacillus cremeus]|uniref:histidine kinase n=1 Tax=Paenibacillus cremeus TaxID=2163881 RepID=A0A559K6X8_9BACL|nr:ATP-binding protein [Paenibacillus cremeus]TVY07874.1 sensor histidine kinase [Paenibacillus cremeus]
MFSRIRLRLLLLNAGVLILILLALGLLLYTHMQFKLTHQADEALKLVKQRILMRSIDSMLRSNHFEPEADRTISYLLWDEHGSLIKQFPGQSTELNPAASFYLTSGDNQFKTIYYEDTQYRVLQFTNPGSPSGSTTHVNAVSIVRNQESERSMLKALQTDLALGGIVGVLFSLLAGYFLAGHSLKPIRRAWEKQQQFVADASHELRTPTAVIKARTELLFRHPQHTIEEESPSIAVILKESNRMGKLIDDLLTLARTDSNELQIHAAVVPLHVVLQEVADSFRLLAETKDVQIHTNCQKSVVWGDEGRLRQMFIILLDNALKFTPPLGTIECSCHSTANAIQVSVKDSGCGIPEEDLPHIFERFFRGDKVRSRTEGGTGLGLSIAQWIVKAHHGTIRVKSEVGVGAEILIQFPADKRF